MRKLASIRRIKNIEPIEGADRIELATVDGWKVVVAKDVGHQEGDLVVYCEVDSFLPIEPQYEFLRKTSYKKMGNKEGFRLKTIRLRGQVSQGLILPISVLEGKIDFGPSRDFNKHIESLIGQDVSEILGIVKYDPPVPARLAGEVEGKFPAFISKTDQERVQNLSLDDIKGEWVITEKLDGTSFTCFKHEGEFGVCSRNLQLKENEDNTYWKMAKKYNLKEFCPEGYALQGEIIGPGIQKNRYGLNECKLFLFDMYDIEKSSYVPFWNLITAVSSHKYKYNLEEFLKIVPVLDDVTLNSHSIDDILEMAEGKSTLNSNTEREGLVFKNKFDPNQSFKAISNKFLLKE